MLFRSIVAVFSQGDDDNLMVGRNGIFYDRKGKDYDATISKIVSNPISIRQAFFSPYKKLVRMIEEMASKRAAAADADVNAKLQSAASSAVTADLKAPEPPKKMDVGVVAAIGVALGAISTVLATVFTKVVDLSPSQKIMVPILLIVVISGPSMILAWFKLRKRNLGPILDANGWAVNAKAKINIPFGTSLTGIAALPPGSQRDLTDRFAEKKNPWPKRIVLLIILWIIFKWLNGGLDSHLPKGLKHDNYFEHDTFFDLKPKAPVVDAVAVPLVVSTNQPPAKN